MTAGEKNLAKKQGRQELQRRVEGEGVTVEEMPRAFRMALGVNQEKFGKYFGLTRRQVSELENGQVDPRLSTLKKIAARMGYEIVLRPKRIKPRSDSE